MVDARYIEQKAGVIASDIGYICNHATANQAYRLKFEVNVLYSMAGNVQIETPFDNITDTYICKRMFSQAESVRAILEDIKDPSHPDVKKPSAILINDVDWCLNRLACIVMEITKLFSQSQLDDHREAIDVYYKLVGIQTG